VISTFPGFSEKKDKTVFSDALKATNYLEKEWNQWLNSGYPFAKLVFDSISYPESAMIYVRILPGPFIENGQLIVHGDSAFKNSMLRRWFRFQPGQPFAWNRFLNVPGLASRLFFAKEVRAPELEWFGDKAFLHVYLEKKGGNAFSGILGLLPASGTKPPVLTGNLDASFNNLFGIGAGLIVKWSRFAPSSQTADLQFRLPALNYNGLGVEAKFEFFRQDSLYTRQQADLLAIQTSINNWDVQLGLSAFGSSGQFATSTEIKGQTIIRGQGVRFGLSYAPDPDFNLVPGRKKAILQITPTAKSISSGSGKRTIPHLVMQSSGTWPLMVLRNKYFLNSSWKAGGVFSKEILLPDMWRVGGIRDLRGFYENEFFASRFAVIGLQPQVWLDNSLLFGLFSDVALLDLSVNQPKWSSMNWAMNLGISVEFETGSNLIRLSFANGRLGAFPSNLRSTKIHFGYLARF
jgi:hypothetical protein